MLLKQMLESATGNPNLVVFDPFQPFDREALLKEVVGLANAKVEGPRSILFGVNPGAVNGNAIVGIPDDAMRDLKRAHRLVSAQIEPLLELAFIFDRINGKLVGALEIDGCEFGPYFLAQDLSGGLRRGDCWIRDDRELVAVDRRELLNGHAVPAEEETPAIAAEDVDLTVGFNDDPNCEFIEFEVPDTSDPPFTEDGEETRRTSKLSKALSTVTTQILRMSQLERQSGAEPGDTHEDAGMQVAAAARRHYFYEERAVKVDFCIRNDSDIDIKDLAIEIGMPKLPGFDVADRICTSPFDKRSEAEIRNLGYPEVEKRKDRTLARGTIGFLPAHESQSLFGTSLRIAVGPEARGKKVAVQYVLRGPDGRRLGDGRLKFRLDRLPAEDASLVETTA